MLVYFNMLNTKSLTKFMALFEGNNILSIMEMITTALQQYKINANVTYRLKHPTSVLEKMITRNLDLHEIKDLIAFRFIVQRLKDCYDIRYYKTSLHR